MSGKSKANLNKITGEYLGLASCTCMLINGHISFGCKQGANRSKRNRLSHRVHRPICEGVSGLFVIFRFSYFLELHCTISIVGSEQYLWGRATVVRELAANGPMMKRRLKLVNEEPRRKFVPLHQSARRV